MLTGIYAASVLVLVSPLIAAAAGTAYVVTGYIQGPLEARHSIPSVMIHGFDIPVTPMGVGLFVAVLAILAIAGSIFGGIQNLVEGYPEEKASYGGAYGTGRPSLAGKKVRGGLVEFEGCVVKRREG
ncbi:hypothetical protein DFH27DRAFT_528224 [Peziza echinospora]|nr:hypothetical protein DFH27DRAFT_528224 [Peziza echinospora]